MRTQYFVECYHCKVCAATHTRKRNWSHMQKSIYTRHSLEGPDEYSIMVCSSSTFSTTTIHTHTKMYACWKLKTFTLKVRNRREKRMLVFYNNKWLKVIHINNKHAAREKTCIFIYLFSQRINHITNLSATWTDVSSIGFAITQCWTTMMII